MHTTYQYRRKKWLDVYGRRKRKCSRCGREPFTTVGKEPRCYYHRIA